jgi:hypothetical protein
LKIACVKHLIRNKGLSDKEALTKTSDNFSRLQCFKEGGGIMTTTIFVYVGLLLLFLLSLQDFLTKTSKRGRTGQYYSCLSLFILINLTIYIGICALLVQVSFWQVLIGQGTEDLSLDKKVLPLVLAFAYFGIGSVNIPVGDKAVSFYGSLLKLFQGMYKPEVINIDPIKKDIQSMDAQSDQLSEAIESFNESGLVHEWSILSDKWKELNQDRLMLEDHSQSLRRVQEELEKSDPAMISKINKKLDEKISQITRDINTKLRRHISALVEVNDKNSLALQSLLSGVGLKLPEPPAPRHSNIAFCRAIVFSFFGGALVGAILSSWSNRTPTHEIMAWMLALGVFGTIFSTVAHLTKNLGFWALPIGAAAGAIGQLSLYLVRIVFGDWRYSLADIREWLPGILVGAVFGACLGALTHSFRYYVRPKVSSCCKCYLLIAVSGMAIFVALGAIMGFVAISNMGRLTFFALLGSSVAVLIAIITNIFHEPV